MVSFNKVILAGNLTRDPEHEMKQGASGDYGLCKFGLAVNEKYGDNEKVGFFDCAATGGLADTIAKYKQKGDPILVEGKLNFYSWETEDGSKRSKVSIKVQNAQFLNRSGGNSDSMNQDDGSDPAENDLDEFEEIPF